MGKPRQVGILVAHRCWKRSDHGGCGEAVRSGFSRAAGSVPRGVPSGSANAAPSQADDRSMPTFPPVNILLSCRSYRCWVLAMSSRIPLVKIFMRLGCSTEVSRRAILDSGCHVADWAHAEQGRESLRRISATAQQIRSTEPEKVCTRARRLDRLWEGFARKIGDVERIRPRHAGTLRSAAWQAGRAPLQRSRIWWSASLARTPGGGTFTRSGCTNFSLSGLYDFQFGYAAPDVSEGLRSALGSGWGA